MVPTPDADDPRDTLESLLVVMRWHPDETQRIAAGKLAVATYVKRGMYTALSILTVDENRESLPAGIPEHAEEKLPAAARKVLQKNDANELEMLVVETELSDDIRNAAGEKLCGFYVKHEDYYNLLKLAENKHAPGGVRISAGKNLVELKVKQGNYGEVLTLSRNRKVPDEVRRAAEAGMKSAVTGFITVSVEEGWYDILHDLATDRKVPPVYRAQARAALGPAAEKAIEDYKKEGSYPALKEMADEPWLPKEVREKVRDTIGAVAEKWMRKQQPDWESRNVTLTIAEDSMLPDTLRKEGLRNFIRFLKQYESELYRHIQERILNDDDLPPDMKAYGISYMLSQKWRQEHATDFLWTARADVLPDNLRLRAVRKAVALYVRDHRYQALDKHIMQATDLPAGAQKEARKYLERQAVDEAQRLMIEG